MGDRSNYSLAPDHEESENSAVVPKDLDQSAYQTEKKRKFNQGLQSAETDISNDRLEIPLRKPSLKAPTSSLICNHNANATQTSRLVTQLNCDIGDDVEGCSRSTDVKDTFGTGAATRDPLSSRKEQKQTSRRKPRSFISHLSFFSSYDSLSDGTASLQKKLTRSIAIQRRRFKIWLVVLTVGFVSGTIIHRNFYSNTKQQNQNRTSTNNPPSSNPAEEESKKCVESPMTNQEAVMELRATSSVSNVSNGAVAADDERCSKLGLDILKDMKGNAIDAAVTTALCLGLVNPSSSGIGGGGFILIYSQKQPDEEGSINKNIPFVDRRELVSVNNTRGITEVIDCRETAPDKATYDMYQNMPPSASSKGALSIAVPGELRGLELAHSRYGKLNWTQVVKPVVDLADQGVPVSKYLAKIIEERKGTIDEPEFYSLKKMLTKNNDGQTYLKEGDLMTRPQYATTLRKIMEFGGDYVYNGNMTEVIAQEIQARGGIITEKDLQEYKPILRDPVSAEIDGFEFRGVPPPSSGGSVIIGILRFLSGYKNPFASAKDTLSVHRMVESFKHVFSIRMSLSDPDFSTNITANAVRDLVSGIFVEELRKKTSDYTTLPLSQYGGKWSLISSADNKEKAVDAHEGDRMLNGHRHMRLFGYLEDQGTSHLSVVDSDRNAVSMTTSVNFYFGSNFASSSTGILFNDVMDDFATPGKSNKYGLHPAESNYIQPGKRPLSSMSPTMVFSGQHSNSTLFMVLGSSGGPKIITSVAQVIINHLYLGLDMFQSVVKPRVHDQLLYHSSAGVGFEECPLVQGPFLETSERTKSALRKRHQNLFPLDYLGTCQSISIDLDTNQISAVSDIRKLGMSAGY